MNVAILPVHGVGYEMFDIWWEEDLDASRRLLYAMHHDELLEEREAYLGTVG